MESQHYHNSDLDIRNLNWFKNNKEVNSLVKLTVSGSNLRGIFPSSISFRYPITAIAGPNGSGKSTLLSLAACAFHNDTTFLPQSKVRQNIPYYTYSDFFIFTQDEQGLTRDIRIEAIYRSTTDLKDIRKKKPSGKWNDYNTRPKRVVSFLGINRILPPGESPTHKNYRKNFRAEQLSDENKNVLKGCMSEVFGHTYQDIDLYSHHKYRLFKVNNGINYTGFNMGAGENAVLLLLYEIISAGRGALIVVDEIELGLHISAQKKLIETLKFLCKKFQCQIICSTHSPIILKSLPPSARYLIKPCTNSTLILSEISPEYAFHILADQNMPELSIFVEDDKAQSLLENILEADLRHRVIIQIIGSADNSIPQQMESCYRENRQNFCSIMDGDKRNSNDSTIQRIIKSLSDRTEQDKDAKQAFFSTRLTYLPGDVNPERHLLEELLKHNQLDDAFEDWEVPDDLIRQYCQEGISAGTHYEFHKLSMHLGLREDTVYRDVVRFYKKTHGEEVRRINQFIKDLLN